MQVEFALIPQPEDEADELDQTDPTEEAEADEIADIEGIQIRTRATATPPQDLTLKMMKRTWRSAGLSTQL
jgi:hypothetical protein